MKESLGERIARARRERGLTNAALAEAAGVHINTVSKWINGGQKPDADALDAIARVLGVTTSWLLRGDEAANNASPRKAKLPPRAYTRAYDYLERLRKAGIPDDMIEESERLMTEQVYSKLNKRDVRERTEDDLITDIDAAWSWISEVIERKWGISV